MPALEGMHAPHNESAPVLPPAGYINPLPSDVFRYNRVTPYYPPDPCIRPNEGDLMCPAEATPDMRNHPWMPPAGNDVRMPSDVFRFYKVYPPTGCNPCNPATCPDTGQIMQTSVCPCVHRPRYAPTNPRRHFEYRYPGGASNLVSERPSYVLGAKKCYPPDQTGAHCPHHQASLSGVIEMSRILQDRFQMKPDPLVPDFQAIVPATGVPLSHYDYASIGQIPPYPYSKVVPVSRYACDNNGQVPPDPYSIVGDLRYGKDYVFGNNSVQADPKKTRARGNLTVFHSPDPNCARPYNPSAYICRPVCNRKYLLDCPTQDGPPGDSYTFL
ncbi:hypothetical protein Btru_067470 [Bulinus truncatus]|nr:hypothetical protein Btru_067470 [Bulinus truncatus]